MERETHPSSRARARAPLRIMTPGNVVRGSLLGVVDGRRKDSVLCAHLQCTLRRERSFSERRYSSATSLTTGRGLAQKLPHATVSFALGQALIACVPNAVANSSQRVFSCRM